MDYYNENDIAIIGMACRFPKAKNVEAFWQNLVGGVSSITTADQDQIQDAGLPKAILEHKNFVNASSKLEDARYFDAEFFGLSNAEATIMDPQIRLLLQTSWHALEDAGYASNDLDATVGNFCGMSTNSYLIKILESTPATDSVDPLLYRILNEKDFLATWISYKLNLTGPSFTLQTACSTSLLAVHLACQSLLNQECSMALAGGVCFNSDDSVGYIHVPESILSKDGHCRPFDRDASGTLIGEGVGSVVLKRAEDAIRDGDSIYALIKGTAANNDGANKQGFSTPSVDFQRDVILETLSVADLSPDSIGMIEAHGTGTPIGDPIEVSALTEAFREYTDQNQYCAIGSVKSNIGHLDAAAGVASLIKTALCIQKGELVPSINYATPNPALKLDASPFYVSQSHTPWPDHFELRRAGVSSLGVGGTNVHLLLEQAPEALPTEDTQGPYVVTLSALNPQSLDQQKQELATYLEANPTVRLADVEFTALYGRKLMPYRFSVVCENKKELLAQLAGEQQENCFAGKGELAEAIFLFPGQGSQYAHMASDLYLHQEAFRKDMDFCFDWVQASYKLDLKAIIFSDDNTLLNQTENTQIALFIVEYCMAKELLRSGVQAQAIIGHSLGEYVAACLVGCISIEDALKLVYHRGRLMGSMPKGAMLLVRKTEEELKPLLLDGVSICAYNASDNLVIGGSIEAIRQQVVLFEQQELEYRRLKVSHAYHTPMMEGALEEYRKILAEVNLSEFEAQVFSSHTGQLVEPSLFCTPQYWLDQIVNPVKFSTAIEALASYYSKPVFVEVGPGSGLSSFIKSIFNQQADTVSLLPRSSTKGTSLNSFFAGKAMLSAKGIAMQSPEHRRGRRISLPGYVFSKDYFWNPKKNIGYSDFTELKQSYHHQSEKYQSERIRYTVEIPIADERAISEDLLEHLNQLRSKYIDDIKDLLSATGAKIEDVIEVLYENIAHQNGKAIDSAEFGEEHQRRSSSVLVKPSNATEQSIARHWGDVLGYQPVGVLDNYFEVGGNSLLATSLMTLLSDEFNIALTFKELSECLTIKELALLVDSKMKILELVEDLDVDNTNTENFLEI